MALSGTQRFDVNTGGGVAINFIWSATQNIAANQSTINWTLQLVTGSNNISSSAQKSWTVTVNGTSKSGSNQIGIGKYSSKTLASGSVVVPHNSDGSKSFNYSFSQQFGISGVYGGTKTGSGSATLNPIPRTSSFSLSVSKANLGSAVGINISRATGSFTHTIQYSMSSPGWVTVATGVGTYYNWTVPLDWAEKYMSNTSASWCTIKVITYSGGTWIGEKTARLDVVVPSNIVPTITSLEVMDNLSSIRDKFGTYVQGKSKIQVDAKASGARGSKITNYTYDISGDKYYGVTSPDGTSNHMVSNYVAKSGDVSIALTVTDSRGRTASRTEKINIMAYSQPLINSFSAFRSDELGEYSNDGRRVNIKYSFSISPLEEKNDKNFFVEYRQKNENAKNDVGWTVLTSGSVYNANNSVISEELFSEVKSYDLRLRVEDYFHNSSNNSYVSSQIDIPTAKPLINVNPDGSGIGLMTIAKEPGIHLGGKDEPIFINEKLFADKTLVLYKNINGIDVQLARYGNIVQLWINTKCNKVQDTVSWNSRELLRLPVGFRPSVEYWTKLNSDGMDNEIPNYNVWNKNYYWVIRANGSVNIITRAFPIKGWTNWADGHELRLSATYITSDDVPDNSLMSTLLPELPDLSQTIITDTPIIEHDNDLNKLD